MKDIVVILIAFYLAVGGIIGFIGGAVDASWANAFPGDRYCTYKSLGSRLSIGYVLGCELFKNRY